jgi:hypothetical protein
VEIGLFSSRDGRIQKYIVHLYIYIYIYILLTLLLHKNCYTPDIVAQLRGCNWIFSNQKHNPRPEIDHQDTEMGIPIFFHPNKTRDINWNKL